MNKRAGAGLQIAGVATFILCWSILGTITEGYDPINDAISRLAEQGAPYRGLMTIGMVAFGMGAIAFAPALGGAGGIALAVAGFASFEVALFPCTEGCPGPGVATDTAHTVAAAVHYVALVATPLLVRKHGALPVAIVAAIALALHGVGWGPNGLLQRVGLTVLDLWLVVVAIEFLREEASAEQVSSTA